MSLRKKIIAALVLCISITFIPFLYIIETEIKPMNLAQVEHQTLQLITSKANEIGSWLNQRISEIKIINEFPYCKTLNFSELKPYLTQINETIHASYGNNGEAFAIGGLDGKGWINDNITIDVSKRPYFQKAMSTDKPYIISEPVVSKADQNPIFLICYPILSASGSKLGFINGAISLELFSKITEDIDIYDGFSWIMNNNAEVYTSSTQNFETINLSTFQLKEIVNETDKSASGFISLNKLMDKDSTVFYSAVPHAEDWILCTLVDNKNVQAQTNKFIKLIFRVITFLLIGSILIAIIISGSITKSLKQLKRNMIDVSTGNLDSFYKSDSKDEISILGKVFNTMLYDIKSSIKEIDTTHELKRSAELRALQSQINPHFLYNTLDTIQWKALSYKAYDVVEMIQLLSKLFRLSLSNGKETISIQEELSHVETYLKIQKIRYSHEISYIIEANNLDDTITLPKLIIQPLVENSIYHGIKPKKNIGKIEIKVYRSGNSLFIMVSDDGIGISKEALDKLNLNLTNSTKSEHYGLYNVNERLNLSFPSNYYIHIESQENLGTKVLIKIPIMGDELH